jgi:nitrate/TMAO reductase-like tetraheme cytochrome c subunit
MRGLTLSLLLLLAVPAWADRGDWVGSEACGVCHPTELAAWKVTPHARAADHLGTRPRPRCLGCHGTGDAPAGKAAALEVGCEACHGAGHDYAEDDVMRDATLAAMLGSKQTRDVCASCHRGAGTRLAPLTLDGQEKVH